MNSTVLIEAIGISNDSGLGRVSKLIIDALKPVLKDKKVVIITRKGDKLELPDNWKQVEMRAKPFRFWIHFIFPMVLLRFLPAKVICLGQTIPRFHPKSLFYLLVCDAGPLENLYLQTSKFDDYNKNRLPRIIERADKILTISEFSKSRIETLTGKPAQKIEAFRPINKVHIQESYRKEELTPAIKQIIQAPYILTVGNIEPRKNHATLLLAYHLLISKIDNPPKLVIAGHRAWGYQEVHEYMELFNMHDLIEITGYITEAEITALYKNCMFYVSTSLYEGWGFPLFEAISLGCPSIYHKETSQHEFAEGVAHGIDCSLARNLMLAMKKMYKSKEERKKWIELIETNFPEVLNYDLSGRLKEIIRE
ncbi:MAG: glycosyltransferase family 4 protein [Fibrobacteria bacterium]|nr:glycosyltransferase family 4 protein [Fibrobacteria bacterium]